MRTNFGNWPGHIELIEAWWARVEEEATKSTRLTESERLMEAETKIDFASFLFGYVATSFYTAYETNESQWRRYVGTKSLRDFKEHKIKGKNRLLGFGYVGDHGHYAGMRRSFRPEASILLDTYGAEHEITRQAIINQETDELLRDEPQELGFAAADFLARAIISLMVANPDAPDGDPMTSVARGNLTTAQLSEASLVAGMTWMETQDDDDGVPIRMTARNCIVANSTWAMVLQRIVESQSTGTTAPGASGTGTATSVFDKGTKNPIASAEIPADFGIKEPYWPAAADWTLVADPTRFPAYIVGLLRGQEDPFIGQEIPSVRAFNGGMLDPYQLKVDKIASKVRHDHGLASVEPRAIYAGRPT